MEWNAPPFPTLMEKEGIASTVFQMKVKAEIVSCQREDHSDDHKLYKKKETLVIYTFRILNVAFHRERETEVS